MKKHFTILSSLLIIAVAGLALWTVQAQPVPPDKPHCAVRVYDAALQRDGELQQCFDTAAAAVEFATDGRVVVPENASRSEVSQTIRQSQQNSSFGNSQTNQISPQWTDHITSIQWSVQNKSGYTLYFYSSSTCAQTYDGHILSGDYGSAFGSYWNNQIDSAEAFAGCTGVELWDLKNLGGASIKCSTYCSNLGVMNDATTSARTWK